MKAFVESHSYQMMARGSTFERDVPSIANYTTKSEYRKAKIGEAAYSIIRFVDGQVARITWLGAYEHALNGEVDGLPAGNKDLSVQYADDIVTRAQGSGMPKDLSPVMRSSSGFKHMMTNMYGFMNMVQNNMYEINQKYKRNHDLGELINGWISVLIVPAMLGSIPASILKGDWEEAINPLEWIKDIIGYRLGAYWGIRDIWAAIGRGYPVRSGPVGAIIDSARTARQRLSKDEIDDYKAAMAIMKAVGTATGYPTDQVLIAIDGIADIAAGETSNPFRLIVREKYEERK
jgi:hypothetical protein